MNTPEVPVPGSLKPLGSECPLAKCPPGLFLHGETLCFMAEYGEITGPDAYVVASGEYFWGGTRLATDRMRVMVVPVVFVPNNRGQAQPPDKDKGVKL